MNRTHSASFKPIRLARPVIVAAVAALCGCAHFAEPILPDRPQSNKPSERAAETTVLGSAQASNDPMPSATGPGDKDNSPAAALPADSTPATSGTRLFKTPAVPVARATATGSAAPAVPGTAAEQESSVALDQLPLPVFIETVYSSILKLNVSMDPSIAQRKELVSLKTGKPLSASALGQTMRAVLKSYGLAVTEYEGLVRITPMGGNSGYLPELLRGRAMPDVPASLRPVFYLAELDSVSPANVSTWLRTLFGQRINIQDDLPRQGLLLSGQSDDIAAALEAIAVLDQPAMRGRTSARVAPLYWSADELAKRMSEVLQAQGYSVGISAGAQTPIILLPIGPLNSVIVFAASEAVLNHALRWASELDQPASGRGTAGYFTYPVRNMDASDLAKTLQEVMNPAAGGSGGGVRSRVVVNAPTNTLIIQGSPTEYQQWFGLLQELDRPARTALISITIAEVTLGDKEALGFDWVLQQFRLGGITVSGLKTAVGAVSKDTTLSAILTNNSGSVQATLGALASTNRARILANPSVMARNGEQASIQVGQDVPILTQQQQAVGGTSGVPGGTTQPNILSTIQYRNTGVILRVKPVIHAGGRIDVDVEQEVSSAVENTIGGTTSPVISNRRISTKMSVTDGNTVLLGGLMREDNNRTESGIPLLKDIPVMGALFKGSTVSKSRTELVMLITPYVISDEFEARAITDAFRKQFKWEAKTPAHELRPPLLSPTPRTPDSDKSGRGGASNQSIPYTLPPADVNPQARQDPASPSETVVRPRQSPRDFPVDPATGRAAEPTGSAGKPQNPNAIRGAAQTRPTAPGNKGGPGTGKPVDDPQLLKELMDALNQKPR